jgi:hypothetical protein
MPTLPDLFKVPRAEIRYVLICLKNGTKLVKPEHQELRPVVEAFMAENGVTISDFHDRWDIGIDTIDTMHMRTESWWLWGISHMTVVPRPAGSANVVAGFDRIFAAGFGVKGRKTPFTRDDYKRILEGAATRKGWV